MRPITPAAARTEMLQLAIAGHPDFEVSMIEIERGGASYTVDTLESLHQSAPDHEWYLLMGADTLRDFASWHQPEAICRLARIAVVGRPDASDLHLSILEPFLPESAPRSAVVSMPTIGISSSAIRQRVSEGKSIRYRVPRAVEKYIESHGLYQK